MTAYKRILPQVESTLFKVHRHFLVRESEVFETMFSLPAAQGKAQVEEHTKLPDVTAAELEALLIFFYDGYVFRDLLRTSLADRSSHRMHALPQDWKFWSNLLSIATRFCFDKIRQRAISQLASSLTPIEQIYHGKKYDVPNWLREGYQSVCKRSEPLELSEAEKIGWEEAIMLAKAREIYYRTDLQETMDLGSPRPLFSNTSSGMTAFGGNFFQAEITSLSEDDRAARAIDTVFGPLRSVLKDSQPVRNEVGEI